MSNQVANVPTALTPNAFTRAGYSFANWNTAANGTGTSYANGATYSFAADITLYAQWTTLPNHTVTFNSNGGTGTMSNAGRQRPNALDPQRLHTGRLHVRNWNTAANGTGTSYANGAVYPFAADATLYAQWTQGSVSYNIPLVSGWNLVSFNIHPTSTAVVDVLATVAGNYSLAYAWDAAEASWMKYDPSQPFGNTLAALDETMGFWIKMSAAATLTLSGTAPTTSNIALESGWNLVGFPRRPAWPCRRPSASTAWGMISTWCLPSMPATPATRGRNTTRQPTRATTCSELAPGWGYWVRSRRDSHLGGELLAVSGESYEQLEKKRCESIKSNPIQTRI